jgi:methionyl-tRNA formyltransferase
VNLIFAGTPPFAAEALRALHRAGHRILLVLTQPDRPAGRGLKLTPSAVAQAAAALGLPILKPTTLKDGAIQDALRQLKADVMVVAAYGLILPQAVLDIPARGCLNIHGSLLPRWRGAAPVQRAIEAGDTETGIAIMQMDVGLDTGPVLLERRVAIEAEETSAGLFAKLTALGATAIVEALAQLETLTPHPQPQDGALYATKIDKREARIDWSQSAATIERRCRAFDPFPGCETALHEASLKVWRARVVPIPHSVDEPRVAGTVGSVDRDRLVVHCGTDALSLVTVQRPGGKRMAIADFLRAHPVRVGEVMK